MVFKEVNCPLFFNHSLTSFCETATFHTPLPIIYLIGRPIP